MSADAKKSTGLYVFFRALDLYSHVSSVKLSYSTRLYKTTYAT